MRGVARVEEAVSAYGKAPGSGSTITSQSSLSIIDCLQLAEGLSGVSEC